ncbi:M24 family metallopeptidase [Steroidobacter sp.]|uniref:M24 family metallopeptidase n=1 Tax=Steroidobacter sp. TaxID=1978227 RepID=UPI001A532B2D|nr:Xaa-Pro peptidase family protein [Steroidobacter sp.]MBL8267987.1 M24 family metallopeptidase [Steroidobacter sp.]
MIANDLLHFGLDEYRERLRRVWSSMESRGIDVLLLTDPCNLYYTTGYDAWSFYVPQCVLIERGSDRPVWIGREMDMQGAKLTTYLEPQDIDSYSDDFVQAADRHPMSRVAELIRARGWGRARIGVELGSYYFSARAMDVLRAELPDAQWLDASLLVNWVRVVKSPTEIRYMREAAQIVQGAMTTAIERTRPGVRQCDVAGAIYQALIGGTREFGGQYASSPPLMPTDERVNTPHLSWTDQPYRPGSVTNFELVASRHRYHMPLGRSISLGQPSPATATLERALIDGIDEVLASLRPGMRASEVESLWQKAASRHGVRKRARCGYSIGIAYPPTFGEQTISLRPNDETELVPGMTLHLMPGVWQQGASLVITEPFLVTESGCEPFCRLPRKLFLAE